VIFDETLGIKKEAQKWKRAGNREGKKSEEGKLFSSEGDFFL